MTRRLRLVHWNPAEARERARELRAAGYTVNDRQIVGGNLSSLRANPPAAFVIDLSRLPSHGRAVAVELRQTKKTRHVPVVFVGGEPEKVARLREVLPDAVYATWRGIRGAVERAVAGPPQDPVVPGSISGYSGTPLPRKLGIKPGMVVALLGAPADFDGTLGALPEGTRLRRDARGRPDLVVWFTTCRADLERRVAKLGALAGAGGLWIAWPKQASGRATDLTSNVVRETGLANGLVDYKVCAIDDTWSGLRFALRK